MPGDPASRNDDDLLGQIDELKARMDRLMRGGTSTSNSALLTDTVPKQPEPEAPAREVPPTPAVDRTRVRDLIGPEDEEIVEIYPGPKETVPFPDDVAESAVAPPPASRPISESRPAPRPDRSAPIGGSVVPVEENLRESRPNVASFDELGDAIQEELAKDVSVPPAEEKKGPDLASRFGPAEQPAAPEAPPASVVEDPAKEAQEGEIDHSIDEVEPAPVEYAPRPSGNIGLVAAVWAFVAIASGAIATLHFTGVI